MATAGGNTLDVLFRLRVDGKSVPADIAAAKKAFSKEFREIEQLASKPLKLNLGGVADPFARINATLERGRQQFVNETIKASEKATASVVSGFIKQNRAAAENSATFGRAADAHVRDFQKIEKSALSSEQVLSKFGGSLRNLGLGLTSLGASLSVALTAPLVALGTISVQSAVSMDSLNRGLTAIVGSASEASVQLKRLTEIAKLPGIGFQEAIQGSIRLQAVGFSAEQAEKALIQFSNAVALTGGGRDELARITVQLGQLASKGKVLAQDLRPIIEAAPAVGRALKQAFGTVNADDIAQLTGSSEKFFEVLVTQLGELPRAAAGARNTFDNFSDAIFRATAAIGEGILPALTAVIETIEPIITAFAAGFKSLPGPIQAVVVVLGTLLATLGPILFVLGQFSTGIGGLISAFARLSALGITPTISGLRTLIATMTVAEGATIKATRAAVLARATFATLAATLVPIAGLLLLTAAAVVTYASTTEKATAADVKGVQARVDRIKQLRDEAAFLRTVVGAVALTAKEQDRLLGIYESLDAVAQARVRVMQEEAGAAKPLADEVERLADAEQKRLRLDQAKAAADFAAALDKLNEQLKERGVLQAVEEDIIARRLGQADKLAQATLGEIDSLQVEQQQLDAAIARRSALQTLIEEQEKALNALALALEGSAKASDISVRSSLELANVIKPLTNNISVLEAEHQRLVREQNNLNKSTTEVTKEIDKQTESLRALRRALREAEVAAKSRTDAARREFEEGRINSARATAAEIASAQQRRKLQLQEIDTFLEGKRKEREAEKDLAKQRQLENEIQDAESRRRTIIEESENEIANLRSAQRLRERNANNQAQESIIAIQRETAEQKIDLLRAEIDADESLRLKHEKEIVAIEQRITDAEIKEIERRRGLVAAGTEASDRLLEQLDLRRAQKKRQQAEGDRRIRDAELADELRSVTKAARDAIVSDIGDQSVIDRLREGMERQGHAIVAVSDATNKQVQLKTVRTWEQIELNIKKIVDDGFERRIKVLDNEIKIRRRFNQNVEELEAEKARLEQERQNAREEGDRRVTEGKEKDIDITERQIRQSERLLEIERSVAAAQLAVREATLNAARRFITDEATLINQRFNLEAEQRKLALDERIDQLEAEERAEIESARKVLLDKKEFEAEKKRIEDFYRALRKAAEDRAFAEDTERERERVRQLESQDPNSRRSLLGDTFADAVEAIRESAAESGAEIGIFTETLFGLGAAAGEVFAQMSADVGNFFSIALNGVGQLITGIGDLVSQWVLLGETGTASLRRLLAGLLAYYAKSFIIKAIDNVAEGFSNLAKSNAAFAVGNVFAGFAYANAAKDNFIAAAKYGIAGIGAAIAGRAAAGDLFSDRGGGGSGTASAAVGGGAQNREFSYGAGVVEPSSAAAREGSGNVFARTIQQVRDIAAQQAATSAAIAQQLNRIGSMPPGDVVTIGAPNATQAIGAAVIQHSTENNDFNRDLSRNQGWG